MRKLECGTANHSRSSTKNPVKTNEYELVMENVKLAQLNAAYLCKISDMESGKKVKQIEIKK